MSRTPPLSAAALARRAALAAHLQHGQDWQGQDLTGWLLTEKFDGCRAYWTGEALVTRSGAPIDAPAAMLECLPRGMALDCEVWAGRGRYEVARRAVQCGEWAAEGLRLMVFDVVGLAANAATRACEARRLVERSSGAVQVAMCSVAEGSTHALRLMRTVVDHGGEGLVALHPTAGYTSGRTSNLLKLKAHSLELATELGL
jgi:DNA ligase-1